MKNTYFPLLFAGLLFSSFPITQTFSQVERANPPFGSALADNSKKDLKQAAFDILNTRCNACHRKQNPFRVFSLKNMEKHAPKIHEQVFVKRRMPKGEQTQLTDLEYQILQQWLHSQNIF